MRDDVVEQYEDVLQNIEAAIVQAYNSDPSLLDLDVMDLLDAAIRRYGHEAQGRAAPSIRLPGKVATAYALVECVCEWRLGRASMDSDAGAPGVPAPTPLTVQELLPCLKRIRKSVKFWNDEAGRQGYLDYVSQFL